MVKNIKKSFKYFMIFIGIMLAFPMLLSLVIRIPQVQTFMVRRITSHLSERIKSTISVGRIEFRFFNKLVMDDILIKDQNNDTMLYSRYLAAGIKDIDFGDRSITLGRVTALNPVVSLITDSAGMMNLRWYLNILRPPEDTAKKKTKTSVIINQVDLRNARFSIINRTLKASRKGIDFSNLHLSSINGTIEEFRIRNDTTSFGIYNLSFIESGGFTLRKMNSLVSLARNNILFTDGFLDCDSSIINVRRADISVDSSASWKNFLTGVRLDIQLDRSLICSSDLQHFMPPVRGMNESIWLSGRIYGTVSELRGRDVQMSYGNNTFIDSDFDISGLPSIENSFMFFGINEMSTNAKDLEKLTVPGRGSIKLPDFAYKVGQISFDGSFTGFTTDFVAYGKLRTGSGTIITDISLRPEEKNRFKVKGFISGRSIALGELAGKSDLLGELDIKANVDGYASSYKKFSGSLTGIIDSIELNKYKYRNISLNGAFSEKAWDGNIRISEDNIRMDLLGMLNFSGDLPEFDFTLNLTDADLGKLHFDKSDTSSSVSMLMTANFKGNNIDNLDGEIKLLNLNLRKFNKVLELYDFSVRTYTENDRPAISLRTDFLDADLKGYYNFAGLETAFKSALSSLMPSRVSPPKLSGQSVQNDFTFDIRFRNTDKINNFFRTGLLMSEKSRLQGRIFPDSIILVKGEARSLNLGKNLFRDFSFEANYLKPDLSANIKCSSLTLLGQSELKGFSVRLDMKPDNFLFAAKWDNQEKDLNRGDFSARGYFTKAIQAGRNAILSIEIDSSDIYTRNNLWKMSRSSVSIDSNSVRVDMFKISNKDRYYLVNGTLSESPADTLHLKFRRIDLEPLNYMSARKKDPTKIPMSFKGLLNGNILLTNIYKSPLIESDLKVNKFSMLQSDYGDISIVSEWNSVRKVAEIKAGNNLDGKKMIDISGYYDPSIKYLNLSGVADKLPADALNPLLKVFASGITGTASGRVNLSGGPGSLVLNGALMAENASMKIDYLQTKYRFNDSIRFARNAINFRNVRATDERGNNAILNGSVNHKYFKDYAADLKISANECMVLNTRQKDNELFYGTAFASGVATIKSNQSTLSFDISAKTGKNTKFYIPLNTSETISDYSFITFLNHDTAAPAAKSSEKNAVPQRQTGMDLTFDLEVTPDAEVQLIFDPKVGDVMKGHGSGNLNISMDSKGEFRISGDYIIDDGDYLFTLQNIINKDFNVESGGKISFNGDIDNAEIDIKAAYKLKTSLFPILQDEKFNERIPVECQISLTGKLFNPMVELNIYLPMADEGTRSYLRNAITTQEELNRQFLYLLVMNSFYADQAAGSSLSTSAGTGTSAMAVTTSEMISNQLSNWISQISNDFDLGFTYLPGRDINPQEVQVALSTQLLNDRVIINGNFDVRGPGGTTQNVDQLTGDFDVEYKLTDRIRFKVFNRFNNPYSGKQAPYTQGFGFFYKQDFDKFSDLFRKKEKPEMKKEEEPEAQEK